MVNSVGTVHTMCVGVNNGYPVGSIGRSQRQSSFGRRPNADGVNAIAWIPPRSTERPRPCTVWLGASHAASLWRAHRRRGPAATQSRRRPDPAAAHHPPSPWVPWPPSSPPQLLALRPSPPQPFNRSSSTGGVLTHLASPHRRLVTAARIPIHHLAAAIINPASKVWCRSARGDGSQQASQQLCRQLLSANAAL